MTEVILERDDRDLTVELCVRGHAGYAPPGQDIVCAAVSVLAAVAAKVALRYREDGAEVTVDADDGAVRVTARFGDKDAYGRFSGQMDAVAAGYKMLTESYPEHVKLRDT